MIGEITPLVEAASRRTWLATVIPHILGSTISAGVLGLVLATLGQLAGVSRWPAVGLVGGLVLVACSMQDAGMVRWAMPSLNRQTPRWFRGSFSPPWCGLLWGLDLGQGWTTHILFTGYYALVLLAVMLSEPVVGALLMASYGFGRGLPVLVTGIVAIRRRQNSIGTLPIFNQPFLQHANAVVLALTGGFIIGMS